jgi:phosphate-selective porin OprO/OprP
MVQQILKWYLGLVFGFLISMSVSLVHANPQEVNDLKKDVQELSKRVEELEGSEPSSSESKKSKDIQTHWKDGLHFKYEKDGMALQWGGRIQNDWLFWTGKRSTKNAYGEFNANGNGPSLKDGTEFRRARIFVSGIFYDHVKFKAQYDFAEGGGLVGFKDVYMGVTKIPYVGTILVGHMKEPFSLEELTSSKYITFLERGLPNVFSPSRNTGVLMSNDIGKRLTYAIGVFRETNGIGMGVGDHEYNLTGRITALPVYSDGGKMLVHLGGAFSFRNPNNNAVRYRQRPEAHLTPRFVDTRDPITGSDLQSDGVQLYGAEAAAVFGPFSIQGEYMASILSVSAINLGPPFAPFPFSGGGNAFFQGGYVYASYFLTGEHRPYKTSSGTFSRVKPNRVFMDGKGGKGAFEVAARYSRLDLEDGPFNRGLGTGLGAQGGNAGSYGTMDNYTMAFNWYLNPNTRVMFNYIISDPDPNGLAHLFNTRFQIDF